MQYNVDRWTILTLSKLTSQGKCWVRMEPGKSYIHVTFDPSHPMAHRGYAHVSYQQIAYSRDENGTEVSWAQHLREQGPQPSAKPCHNHNKRGCTADGCF